MPRVLTLNGRAAGGDAGLARAPRRPHLIDTFARFEGRLSRGGFWGGLGVLLVLGFVLAGTANVLDWMLELRIDGAGRLGYLTLAAVAVIAYGFFALQTKRWHDRDKSGWWNLLVAVPVIGLVWTLVEAGMLAGTPGPNQYGPASLG